MGDTVEGMLLGKTRNELLEIAKKQAAAIGAHLITIASLERQLAEQQARIAELKSALKEVNAALIAEQNKSVPDGTQPEEVKP